MWKHKVLSVSRWNFYNTSLKGQPNTLLKTHHTKVQIKSTTPYKRTHPSTLQRMKQVAKDHKPSFKYLWVGRCWITRRRKHKLPRIKRQVTDIHKRLFAEQPTDELVVMMEKCKCTEPQFVWLVQAAPQPLCILTTDLQLKQVQFCCTDPENFSILSIDPTFNLGAFYVTPVVFLYKAFVCKRTGNPPIFLGPVLIHQRMNTKAYRFLLTNSKFYYHLCIISKLLEQMTRSITLEEIWTAIMETLNRVAWSRLSIQ